MLVGSGVHVATGAGLDDGAAGRGLVLGNWGDTADLVFTLASDERVVEAPGAVHLHGVLELLLTGRVPRPNGMCLPALMVLTILRCRRTSRRR